MGRVDKRASAHAPARAATALLLVASFGVGGCFRFAAVPGDQGRRLAALEHRDEVTLRASDGEAVRVGHYTEYRLRLRDGRRLRVPDEVGYGPTSMRLLGPRERGIVVPYDQIIGMNVEVVHGARLARNLVLGSVIVTGVAVFLFLVFSGGD